jgi:hypothetical protein
VYFVYKKESTQPIPFERYLVKACGKLNEQVVIVGLTSFEGRFVSDGLSTFITTVNDNISFFRIGKSLYRAENSATVVGSVAGIYVNVKRAKAEGTMIS